MDTHLNCIDAERTFRSMATDVSLRVVGATDEVEARLDAAVEVFARVSVACTRFDESSPLMQANAASDQWHDVPWELAASVVEAQEAYRVTSGVFDPRVIDVLVRLGYDRTLPSATGGIAFDGASLPPQRPGRHVARPPWRPRWEQRGDRYRINLGGTAIDLGGIGKGLAVRWAFEELARGGASVMVDAGGDCQFCGTGPSGEGWRVGMEDPRGGSQPLLVFSLRDIACATSSVRVRRWQSNGREVHHLIDPRTGASGGGGLLSVTVIDPDPAWAEVWSKTLFLAGPGQVEGLAEERHLAAAWVTANGVVGVNGLAADNVIWAAAHV
jgi:thiamine biosynthesis lipoprotein